MANTIVLLAVSLSHYSYSPMLKCASDGNLAFLVSAAEVIYRGKDADTADSKRRLLEGFRNCML